MLCPKICVAGLQGCPTVTAEEVSVEGGRPVIRLSLRKPRAWGLKLTASASTPAVVCLVDDNGNVVHDSGDGNINRATALDRSRHWNERTNQRSSSSSSDAEADTRVNRPRRYPRKNDSGYKSLRRGSGHSSVRRGKDIDNEDSPLRRGKEVGNEDSPLRRDTREHSGHSSVRRGKEMDNEDSPLRRGKEVGNEDSRLRRDTREHSGHSSVRRGKEMDNEDSSLRRGKKMDNGDASARRGKQVGNENSPLRRGKEMDNGDASARKSKATDKVNSSFRKGKDTGHSSLRRTDEMDTGQLSFRRGKGTGHSSLRRGNEIDSDHSPFRRGKEIGIKTPSLRRGKEKDSENSLFRRENDTVHSSLRRGQEIGNKYSSFRRGKELDSEHSSFRRGNDTVHSSLRREKEIDNKYSSFRREKELDSEHSSFRRGNNTFHASLRREKEIDNKYSSLRRGKEADSKNLSFRRENDTVHASLRRGKEIDNKYSSLRRGTKLDGQHSSFRRDKMMITGESSSLKRCNHADIGYSSLTRGKESAVTTDADASIQRGRRRHRREETSGRASNDAAPPPPRRPRRRPRPLRTMGSNVSRQGLSGRRTQSSGNLCNGNKLLAHDVGHILSSSDADKERYRLCGSLPNYLDDDRSNNNDVGASSMKARLQEQKRGLELRLLPQQDLALQDQGYASERSPEDEHPPPLPPPEPELGAVWCLTQHYPFITPEALFEVTLSKGNRGLGLSVTGGVETAEQWPGLIRIKRLFPHQPAWQSGQLASGDILLAVNGVPLTGLTNYQALEVLRTSPSTVLLEMCRPPSDVFCAVAPSEPPLPPRRDTSYRLSSSQTLVPLPLLQIEEPCGEFDIILQKVNRSLGFTLRKEDESVLGHYVRALVREPALSDGRIRPGDKIVEVNDVPLSPMSHEEAVTFLRQCGETVKLRLYRDAAQTPVAALSPSDADPPGCIRPRPMLRQEARDMLTDLAVRKLSPTNSGSSAHSHLLQCLSGGSTPGTSPRRRRLTKTPSPDIATVARDRLGERHLSDDQRNDVTDSLDLAQDINNTLPRRPQFLDLQNENESPQTSRRPKYTFSAPGDYEGSPEPPASLPPLSSTSTTSTAFSYRNPAYHSANPIEPSGGGEGMTECSSERDVSGEGDRACGLLKWKGVMFTPQGGGGVEGERVLTVELNRGWNSRLGFSLRADGRRTYVSAIYADSVAAKDGRLRAQDQLLMVNDENVETMTTEEIIDLLRKIRGTIEIKVLRKSGPNLQPS